MASIFIDAAVISVILYGGVFLMIRINPRSQLHNYPDQIKKAVPPQNGQDRKVTVAIGIPLFILIIGYVVVSFYQRFHGSDMLYLTVLLHWFAVYLLTCTIDLFICDYLIFCTITPKFVVIPGTEGNPGYKDKSFHTRTIPRMFILSMVLGALSSLTYFLV